MTIEPLSSSHDRTLFNCGDTRLNNFLKDAALSDMNRNVGITSVLLSSGQQRVEGYYTLCSCSLSRASVSASKKLNYRELPAILMGRLAVDVRLQGQGYGKLLLYHALRVAARQSKLIAAHSVVVDVQHEKAERFYLSHDFVPAVNVSTDQYPKKLYLEMKLILAAGYADINDRNMQETS